MAKAKKFTIQNVRNPKIKKPLEGTKNIYNKNRRENVRIKRYMFYKR